MMSARVRGTGPCAWSTVFCMVSSFRFGGGWDLGPRRAHSRLGGGRLAAVHSEGSDGTDGAPCGRVAHVTGDRPLDPGLNVPPEPRAGGIESEPGAGGSRDPGLKLHTIASPADVTGRGIIDH